MADHVERSTTSFETLAHSTAGEEKSALTPAGSEGTAITTDQRYHQKASFQCLLGANIPTFPLSPCQKSIAPRE
jgi:hypothetical protein